MIIIDADACPSIKLIEDTAKKHQIKTLICSDPNRILNSDYSKIIYVDQGNDSVDLYIANTVKKDDIVITQDYGVATTVLAKEAYAINPKGLIYDDSNIDSLMLSRHMNKRLRRQGFKIKGPKKRTKEDDVKLISNLELLIVKVKNKWYN